MYIHIYIYIYTYVYHIHIYREREIRSRFFTDTRRTASPRTRQSWVFVTDIEIPIQTLRVYIPSNIQA